MRQDFPTRLTAAEETLAAQLDAAGASDAAERFRTAGLPTRRVETYHYTDLKSLLRDVPEIAVAAGDAEASPLALPGAVRLGIANGTVQKSEGLPKGVKAGRSDGSNIDTRDDTLVRLNVALARESLHLTLEGEIGELVGLLDSRIQAPIDWRSFKSI